MLSQVACNGLVDSLQQRTPTRILSIRQGRRVDCAGERSGFCSGFPEGLGGVGRPNTVVDCKLTYSKRNRSQQHDKNNTEDETL